MVFQFLALAHRAWLVAKLYKVRRKYEKDPVKLALIDSLINQLVMARSPPAYTIALQSLAEAAKVIPELKELIG
jgi:hypothetical protein